ncbi:hypothetical protein BQ8794_70455 [Mesorhizobium prunaredense]|uniref:Uncharacterized protein n=1 Tax=Mesorhizobium prunaredense TaxID=1631249 RepID=A0A1R3VI61_9HYPH|nr:hypothetical protein BQ8794_70455 [Mesorhizobium prunaredense]
MAGLFTAGLAGLGFVMALSSASGNNPAAQDRAEGGMVQSRISEAQHAALHEVGWLNLPVCRFWPWTENKTETLLAFRCRITTFGGDVRLFGRYAFF